MAPGGNIKANSGRRLRSSGHLGEEGHSERRITTSLGSVMSEKLRLIKFKRFSELFRDARNAGAKFVQDSIAAGRQISRMAGG